MINENVFVILMKKIHSKYTTPSILDDPITINTRDGSLLTIDIVGTTGTQTLVIFNYNKSNTKTELAQNFQELVTTVLNECLHYHKLKEITFIKE